MATSHKTVSIALAGYGQASTGLPYRIRAAATNDVGGTVTPAPLLADWPENVLSEIDIVECWVRQSTLSFVVTGLDTHEQGRELLSWSWQARPEPVGWNASAINAGDLVIYVYLRAGFSFPAPPFNAYLERECLWVTNVTPPPVWFPWMPYTLDVQRGMYGTSDVAHASAESADREVFLVNPIVFSREMWVYELDTLLGTEACVWRGYMEQPEMVSGLAACRFSARDAWACTDRKLGGARLRTTGKFYTTRSEDQQGSDSPYCTIMTSPNFVTWTPPLLFGEYMPLVCRDTVLLGRIRRVGPQGKEPQQWDHRPTSATLAYGDRVPMLGTEWPPNGHETTQVAECFVTDADDGTGETIAVSLCKDEGGNPSDHPLDVLLCILTSTGTATTPGGIHLAGYNGGWDWLAKHWGAGIPVDFVDTAAIVALRDSRFLGVRMRNGLIADEDPPLPDIIRKILQPLFLLPAISSEGKLTLIDPRPQGTSAATPIAWTDVAEVVANQPWAEWEQKASVVVNLARRGLGDKFGQILEDRDIIGSRFNRYPSGAQTLTIDGGWYGHPVNHLVDVKTYQVIRKQNRFRWDLLVSRLPVYTLVLLPGLDVAVGEHVSLTYPALIGDEGERGVTAHECLVLRVVRDWRTRVQTVALLDLYPLTRAEPVVAPSWRVAAVVDATHFTVAAAEFTANDPAQWVNGRRVDLWTAAGVKVSDTFRSGNIVGANVTLGAAWTSGGIPRIPIVGEVVRIATYDNRALWDGKAYIADSNAQLGAANDAAHRWSY